MRIDLSRTEGRCGLVGLAAFGLVHVLVPRLLLRGARTAYGLALDVDFAPRGGAPRRVRSVGFSSLVTAAAGWVLLDRLDETRLEFSTSGSESESPSFDRRPIDDH